MRILTGIEVIKQVVWNRDLEIILEMEDADKVYIDPYTAFDRYKPSIDVDIRWDNAKRFTPFLELCINRNAEGVFSYRVDIHSYDDLTSGEWRDIRDCVQNMLIDYEKSMFGTKGRLFLPQDDEAARLHREAEQLQKQWENRWSLAQQIRDLYYNLLDDIKNDLGKGAEIEIISAKYKIVEEKVRQSLYSTGTGNPTPSLLALKIIEQSPEARELGIPDANRLYDEIISRTPGKEFRKRKKYTESRRLKTYPNKNSNNSE